MQEKIDKKQTDLYAVKSRKEKKRGMEDEEKRDQNQCHENIRKK